MSAVADAALKSTRFRQEREADWRRLERLLRRLETEPLARLSDEDLIAVPVLYRAALSSLSVARETSLDQALLEYLEGLCARAYFVVYGARPELRARVIGFFRTDWPHAAQALWRETLLGFALMVLGAAIALALFHSDSDWYYAFIPAQMGGGRDPTTTTEGLRQLLYTVDGRDWLATFASFLFTHNAQIAMLAFALGFACGLPTAFLALTNGCMLGAILALYGSRGLGFQLGGWLFIHGVTELFAITLACAAGFRIGWTLVFPGQRSRADALADAGRLSATLMTGVVVMLFVAGLLEGIGRQTITSDLARYAVALGSGAFWLAYLYLPRPGP